MGNLTRQKVGVCKTGLQYVNMKFAKHLHMFGLYNKLTNGF